MFEQEKSRVVVPAVVRSHGGIIALALLLIAVLVYGLHERGVAARSSAQSAEASAQSQELRAQLGALTAKLDSLTAAQQQAPQVRVLTPSTEKAAVVMRPSANRRKPDPRWKKFQAQLDAQGQQIESTRQEIASARTDLEGSIARTHEELVVLQKKGERNYVEFDLDKSKSFHPEGPVGVSLRKADVKGQYCDLHLLVDDREISKKHLNLYEPAVFYPTGERQAVELIINSITKNHIHGYISAPKYRASELAAAGDSGQQTDAEKNRRKLEVPR
jgi:hypothetical protein